MDKYLFCSDLDGTLLNKKHVLSKKTIKYIKKLVKQGHYFVINTGRPYQGSIHFIKQLGIDCPFICDNGGSIYWDNKIDFPIFTTIPVEPLIKFLKEVNEYIYSAMFSSHQKIVFQDKKRIPPFIIHVDEDTKTSEGIAFEIIDTPIILGNIFILEEYRQNFNNILKKYNDYIAFREWGVHLGIRSYEIFSSKSSKGNALITIKNYLNISENHTFSFGDDLNDLDMLAKANNGVALANARKTVKINAKYITKHSNDKDGVIKFIKRYLKENGK